MSDPEKYASNCTLEELAARLKSVQSAVILTHSKPDGDAFGSTLALARTLHTLGARATPLYLAPRQPRIEIVVAPTHVLHEGKGCFERPEVASADAVVICDTGSWSQLAAAREFLQPRRERTMIIDHHAHGDAEIAALRHVEPRAASTCELMARLCGLLLNVPSAARFPPDIAEPLYLGVATDTGWFRYSSMTSATLRLAADLVDAGVDHNRLYRRIEQADTISRLRIIERALASLELIDDGRAAVMSISLRDVAETGASQDEVGGLTDLPQTLASVRVVAVLNELEGGITKASFRSKAAEPGAPVIDVNALAQTFGGGGHRHAAGAKIAMPLEQARKAVERALAGVPK
ncbi:MAG: DHH family phosphoesterase [Planctomycetota bacterium]|nr:DHH family phosphoesterase [Planctomycetota bacterium]